MLQSYALFLMLSAVLAWTTIVLKQNLCDAIYNYAVAFPRGFPPLGAAPARRRFAQGSAAVLALAIGMALVTEATMMAWILESVVVAAVASAVVRRFCLRAHVYHVLRRRLSPESGFTAGGASQQC